MATASIFDVLTTTWVKDVFLTGVDLTDDSGVAFPNDMFEASLLKAVAETEQELDIVVDPAEITGERHDLTDRERSSYYPFHLYRRPLLGIDKIVCSFGDQNVAELPPVWANIMDALHGELHLIPQKDNVTQTMPLMVPSLSVFRYDYVPGWFIFTYRAGFRVFTDTKVFATTDSELLVTFATTETFRESRYFTMFDLVSPNPADADITARAVSRTCSTMTVKLSRKPSAQLTVRWYCTDLPDNLRQLIGIRAAKTPLAIAGDLVMGSGVQSQSIGVDGLSQSRTTTKSAMGGAYAGRLRALEAEEAQLLQSLKAAYASFRFMAI